MGLESYGIPLLIAQSLRYRRFATSGAGLPLLRPGRDKSTVRSVTDLFYHASQAATSKLASLFDHLNSSPVVHI